MVDCANLIAFSVLNPLIRAAVKVNKSGTLFLLSSHPHKIEFTILPGSLCCSVKFCDDEMKTKT
jgi:hypothetical protein